jgi:hypothetical protein
MSMVNMMSHTGMHSAHAAAPVTVSTDRSKHQAQLNHQDSDHDHDLRSRVLTCPEIFEKAGWNYECTVLTM